MGQSKDIPKKNKALAKHRTSKKFTFISSITLQTVYILYSFYCLCILDPPSSSVASCNIGPEINMWIYFGHC